MPSSFPGHLRERRRVPFDEVALRLTLEVPGRGEAALCNQKIDHIFEVGSGKFQGLANVFFLKFRILSEELSAIRIERNRFEDAAYGQPHSPNAGLSIHLFRIDGNAI